MFSILDGVFAIWLVSTVSGLYVRHDSSFTPDHILRVTNKVIDVACDQHLSVVVNGTSPGPQLRLAPGTASWIRVYNDIEDQNLTMHWHGLTQRMAPFSDGSPLAAQWPIPPGHFFDYEVETQLGDSGTYFYHSHSGMQAISACGALIVDDCYSSPYDYDEERILQFSDYSPNSDGTSTSTSRGGRRNSDAILLNGHGLRSSDTADGSDSCSLAIIDVDPGKTYRLRYIGATGLSHIATGFEGHDNLTIVQVDGSEYTEPYSVEYLQLGSGQRFDVLLATKTQEELDAEGKSTYYIQFETLDRPTVLRGYGVLRYSTTSTKSRRHPLAQNSMAKRQGRAGQGASSSSSAQAPAEAPSSSTSDSDVPQPPSNPPLTFSDVAYDWLEYTLQPLYPKDSVCPKLGEVTRRVKIDAQLLIGADADDTEWQLAGLSWAEDAEVPLLVDIYQRGQAAIPDYDAALNNYGWDPEKRSFPARLGEVLEVVLQNMGSRAADGGERAAGTGRVDVHPFHIHGQHVWDIGAGDGEYDAEANEDKIVSMGYKPVRRDTTMLYRYQSTVDPGVYAGWRAWRIRVDYAGVWMLHCHTLTHMVRGMQSVWVNGNAEEILKIPLDQSQGYLTYGGDVYGNATNDPTVYQSFEGGTSQCPPHSSR